MKNNILFITGLWLLFISIDSLAQKEGAERIDSLTRALHQYSGKVSDTNYATLLIDLAYEYHKSDPDNGIRSGNEALQLSEKLGWKKGMAMANNRIGLCYWAKSDYPLALNYHLKALKIAEEYDLKNVIATTLGNIGLVYEGQRNYSRALDYHLKSLKLNEELKNKSGIARNLGNIGIVYDAQGDYEHALDYYFKAIKIYEELKDKNGIARNLGNVGFVYQEQNIYDKALEYDFKALKMTEELGNKILSGINLGNIGEVYYSIAVDTSSERMGSRFPLQDRINARIKSEEYLKKSITLFEEIDDRNSLQELYRYLSDLQALQGNYKQSLESFKLHIANRDSVYSEDNKRQIAMLEKNREEDLKQKEIKLLKSQNEVERLTAQRRKGMNYGLGGAFIGLCFVTFAFFNQSKKKERMNNELHSAYARLKITQAELVKQEKLASLGKLTSNIAHEIQNPLNFVNNFSEISGDLTRELEVVHSPEERKEIIERLKDNLDKINQHGKRADAIVKKMQHHLRTGTGHELFEG